MRTAAAEWRRGWRAVAGCAAGVGTGAGLYQYVSSLLVEPIQTTLGWTRGEIATGAAVGLLGALSAPLIGRLADRIGVRPVATVSILLLAATFLGMAANPGSYPLYVALSAMIGLVAPGCTSLVYSRIVNGWFDAARGQALGVMTAGLSLATLLLTPVVAAAIAAWGYQGGMTALAAIAVGIGLPLVLWGARPAPDEAAAGEMGALEGLTWREALAGRGFWLLALAMLLVNVPSAGILTQLAPLLGGKGVAPSETGLYIAAYAGVVLVGRLAIGWLFDRTDARRVAALVTFGGAFGSLLFTTSADAALLPAAILLIGLVQGAESDILAYFSGRLFGRRDYGTIYGALMTVSLLGTAAGVLGFGQLYDATQSYDVALTVAAGLLLVVASSYLMIPRLHRRAEGG